ncbi:DUF4136 domain-containing protein [Flavobacterium anhuiense]|uniref:DUF4136 domain-containing protein n=1 Tax=Flavobacterium anhuiense TaxID=459526 RepID=UPI003D98FCBE
MTAQKTTLRIIPILIFAIFYGCSPTVKVTADYDHSADFTSYRTFAVYDLKAQQGQVNQLNADRVTNAIRNEMLAKGFTESENPDLKVNAVSILKNKTSVSSTTDFYGYGGMYRPYGYWGGGAMMGGANTTFNTYDYVDGSLIIDIVSTKNQKLVWEGIGNAEIDNKPDNPDEFITGSVKKIMEGFPPGQIKK